jgi:predicted nucleic acid-binding protein
MGGKNIINALPLMDGRLINRRKEIEGELIKYTLAQENVSERYTPEEIQTKVDRNVGLNLDFGVIKDSLEKFDFVSETTSNRYKIDKQPDVRDFETEFDSVWEGYKENLERKDADKQIDYDLENHKKALKHFFIQFYDSMLANPAEVDQESNLIIEQGEHAQAGHGNERTEEKIGLLRSRFSTVISNTIDEKALMQPELFRGTLEDYIGDRPRELLQFTGTLYTGAINHDIISRGTDTIDIAEMDDENKILILDTNILIGLLCESDPIHNMLSNVCEKSNNIGYDLYYLPVTAEELERVIAATKERWKVDNQFTRDLANRSGMQRVDYEVQVLDRWRRNLREWEIEELDMKFEFEGEQGGEVRSWIEAADSISSGEKSKDQIQHDVSFISKTARLRDRVNGNSAVGPSAISNESDIVAINKMGAGTKWDKGVVLHPEDWMDYLIAFTPGELTYENKEEIAEAIIGTAADFEAKLGVEEYVNIVATKTNVSKEDEEYLRELILDSTFSQKIQDTVHREDQENQEEVVYDLMEKFADKLEEVRTEEERKQELIDKLNEAVDEKEEKEAKLEELRKRMKDSPDVEVNNNQEVNQDVSQSVEQTSNVELTEEISEQFKTFCEQLEKNLDEGYKDSPIDNPPKDTSDAEDVRDWLIKVEEKLQKAEDISQEAQKMAPLAGSVLRSIQYLIEAQ